MKVQLHVQIIAIFNIAQLIIAGTFCAVEWRNPVASVPPFSCQNQAPVRVIAASSCAEIQQ
jgi:hypothetical protein